MRRSLKSHESIYLSVSKGRGTTDSHKHGVTYSHLLFAVSFDLEECDVKLNLMKLPITRKYFMEMRNSQITDSLFKTPTCLDIFKIPIN
jgi:hypothetical protein